MKPDKLEPHWKTDFSVDWEKTSYITRREFTRFLALGSGAMAVGNVYLAVRSGFVGTKSPAPRLEVASVDAIEVRGFQSFEYPEKGQHAILLRHEDGTLSAFSQRCPHLGCSVYFSQESQKLECPCHEGFFDAKTGDVLAGPPQRGLATIKLEITDGKIFAVEGGEA
jgi:Rieske Fe-S protein